MVNICFEEITSNYELYEQALGCLEDLFYNEYHLNNRLEELEEEKEKIEEELYQIDREKEPYMEILRDLSDRGYAGDARPYD